MALGVVLAALFGGPAAKVGAFLLVGSIDRPHRAQAQAGDPAQAVGQERTGIADQTRNRRRERTTKRVGAATSTAPTGLVWLHSDRDGAAPGSARAAPTSPGAGAVRPAR